MIITLASSAQITAQTANLSVIVIVIDEVVGEVRVALYNKAEGFAEDNSMYRHIVERVTDHQVTIQFKDLTHGDYAIALSHDANMDEEFNFNMIGLPLEGYGFSNNIKPIFKAPSFDKTKFELVEDKQIEIKLIN